MAAKKMNSIRKLINTVDGFEAKRKKEEITLDLPTQNTYDGIVHYLEYMDEVMERDQKDLAQLIYTKVTEFYNNLCTVTFFLTMGKFSEHKEADWLEFERQQIKKGLDAIAREIYDGVITDTDEEE